MISVLFVCMGNICRSPTGEGVFQHFVAAGGYAELIQVDSAGTIAHHVGERADARMRAAAQRRGYELHSIARQVQSQDLEIFDLVLAMDHDNLHELERVRGPSPHIRLLGSFLDEWKGIEEVPAVPDPYYGGERGFEEVLDMIEAACPAILRHCLDLSAKQ